MYCRGFNLLFLLSYLLSAICFVHATENSKISSTPLSPPFFDKQHEAIFFLTPIFDIIDCEGAGTIEDGDVDEHFSELFFYNDRDQTRTILEVEFIRARASKDKKQSAFIFHNMDVNQDKKVTPEEYRQYMSKAINWADVNGDGEVRSSELNMNIAQAPESKQRKKNAGRFEHTHRKFKKKREQGHE